MVLSAEEHPLLGKASTSKKLGDAKRQGPRILRYVLVGWPHPFYVGYALVCYMLEVVLCTCLYFRPSEFLLRFVVPAARHVPPRYAMQWISWIEQRNGRSGEPRPSPPVEESHRMYSPLRVVYSSRISVKIEGEERLLERTGDPALGSEISPVESLKETAGV
ncbi:hypothetical protein DFH08DRAFT_815704 [Mycena albidolilacea]|uniref:Uncharacterized protein n=1 Tax=Mycena albidolilacea TaxID=1033008 RepID=A0AAD6ZNR4_9AGAR|nr:hypothetical protein DFH08DRAFT_815704 [Mycena albidolilacea]